MAEIPLTLEQKHNQRKETAQNWLKKNKAKCPACESKDYGFELISLPRDWPKWQAGNLPAVLTAVAVTCKKCSYLWILSTESMSLPHQEKG